MASSTYSITEAASFCKGYLSVFRDNVVTEASIAQGETASSLPTPSMLPLSLILTKKQNLFQKNRYKKRLRRSAFLFQKTTNHTVLRTILYIYCESAARYGKNYPTAIDGDIEEKSPFCRCEMKPTPTRHNAFHTRSGFRARREFHKSRKEFISLKKALAFTSAFYCVSQQFRVPVYNPIETSASRSNTKTKAGIKKIGYKKK